MLGDRSTFYCKLLVGCEEAQKALLSSSLSLQGPVSSGVLLGCVNSGGGDCQGLLSVRRGTHLTELGLSLSICLDDSLMLKSLAWGLGTTSYLPGQPGADRSRERPCYIPGERKWFHRPQPTLMILV